MTDCPPPTGAASSGAQLRFVQSWCVQDGDIRKYSIDCVDASLGPVGGFHTVTTGSCQQSEVCSTEVAPDRDTQVALCVPISPSLRLLASSRDEATREAVYQLDGPGPSNVNFVLTLAGEHDDILFEASSLSLGPRDKSDNSLAGPQSCTNCAHLSFLKAPPNTANFDINITVPNNNDIAILHSFAWS